jgi:hypothetical protein
MRSILAKLITNARTWRPRFRLGTAFILFLIASLVAGWARDRDFLRQARQVAGITFEIYTDRAAFEQRLAGATDHVDFDDVPTAGNSISEIDSKRYEARGIIIDGGSGQYVSQTFGLPADFLTAAQKNLYAPGPVGQNPGANRTDVKFTAAGGPGLVCGFGVNFFDVDFRSQGPSSITLFDRNGRWLLAHDAFQGPHHAPVFRGIIAVDATGTPVPLIASVRLVNGSGWPGVDLLECVALDDFVFGSPQPFPK